MSCHDVSCAQNCDTKNNHKTEREERQQNKRLSTHQSATNATQDLNRFSILCDSQKHTTCLDTHHKACLKHFHSSMDHNQRYERDEDLLFVCLPPLLRHLLHTITAMGIYGHHPRGLRMQQRIHVNITRPLISTQSPSPNKVLENR